MIIFCGLMVVAYTLSLFRVLFLWKRIEVLELKDSICTEKIAVSILIPTRNEAANIGALIDSIASNDFPILNFEIVVIDDHSTDQTIDVVDQKIDEWPLLNLQVIRNKASGKKQALTLGVSQAKGQLMLCTDGDSIVPKDWIKAHYLAYVKGSKLAFGPVRFINKDNNLWVDALNIELLALVSIGGATLQGGKPTMINGCNYSFDKTSFLEVNGFHGNVEIATGDDEFLLRSFHVKFPQQIVFLRGKEFMVDTNPPLSIKEFYHQRRRWASKWKHHKDVMSKISPLFLFGFYVSVLILAYFSIAENNKLAMFFLSLKILTDYLLLHYISSDLKLKMKVVGFLLQQLFYPFYVMFFGVASNFGTYVWRTREYKI